MSTGKKAIIALITLIVLAAGIISMYAYYHMKVDWMRAAAVQSMRESVDLADYGKKEQKKINKALDAGEEQIMVSDRQYEIDMITTEVESTISEIPTIKDRQKAGRKKLKKLVSLDDYREAERKEVKDILDKFKKKINKETDKKEIDKLVKEADRRIAKIKTDEELDAEEEAARQAYLEQLRREAEAKAKAEAEKKKKEAAKNDKKSKKKGKSGE